MKCAEAISRRTHQETSRGTFQASHGTVGPRQLHLSTGLVPELPQLEVPHLLSFFQLVEPPNTRKSTGSWLLKEEQHPTKDMAPKINTTSGGQVF